MTQPQPTMDWIPELDNIDPSYVITSFRHTLLGCLPTEVLEIITNFLDSEALLVVARVHSKLKALAERQLYREVGIPRLRDAYNGWRGRRFSHMYSHLSGQQMDRLYRTLLARPDLADRVKKATLSISTDMVSIQVPRATVFPGVLSDADDVTISAGEQDIACALLQQLRSVEHMCIQTDEDCTISECPGLNSSTTHPTAATGLQNLKSLEWCGSEVYWTMVRNLPSLRHLHLTWPSVVCSDTASLNETHDSLQSLHFSYSSAVFSLETRYAAYLETFLVHLTALRSIRLDIDDNSFPDEWSAGPGAEGSSAILLVKLEPVAASLKELNITVADSQPQGTATWMYHVIPYPFQGLPCLEKLNVPYTFLFGPEDHQTVPTLEGLLPSTLKVLQVYCPSVLFLDILNGLWYTRDELPALEVIEIECSNDGGDEYNVFAFDNHLHPALDCLRSMGIELVIRCCKGHWKNEWDDYDIPALDMAAWQVSLGPLISGISIVRQPEPENDATLDDLVQMYVNTHGARPGHRRGEGSNRTHGGKTSGRVSAWTARKRLAIVRDDQTATDAAFEGRLLPGEFSRAQPQRHGQNQAQSSHTHREAIIMDDRRGLNER